MEILKVRNVSKSFGGVEANKEVSLEIKSGDIVGLIGPNGSGKSTLFNMICGIQPIDKGEVFFEGKEISKYNVSEIARFGLLRTFQETKIYSKMTCLENMQISYKTPQDTLMSFFSKISQDVIKKSEELLDFVGLYEKRKLKAGDLSFGQQKLLELAMSLINGPKMLILDEPTAGINPTLINGIIDRLKKANEEFNITLFIIEHNMQVIMGLAKKIYCMNHGKILAQGTPEEIKNNKNVINAYLGAV